MIILGLTGSIGMGKSTTAQMFRQLNICVHDADKTVHDLYKNEAVTPLGELFPSAIINGAVDRQILGGLVLNNPDNMIQLENIVHPLVRLKETEFLDKARKNGEQLVVLDIPLLFETGGDKRVDAILVVTADEKIQAGRVLSRTGMDQSKFDAILSKQTPDKEKKQRADFIIDTGLGLDHARANVQKIVEQYQST